MPRAIDRQTRAASFAFPPFMMVFLILVGAGYFSTFRSHLSDLPIPVIVLISAIFVFVVYLLIRHAALTLHDSYVGRGTSLLKWIAILPLVFLLSGLSLVTVWILLFEGPTIMQADIRDMTDAFSKLENDGIVALNSNDYATLKASVESKRTALMSEIDKTLPGQSCGVGPLARPIIDDLKTLLPDVHFVGGTDRSHDCNDRKVIAEIRQIYNKEIDDGLRNSRAYITSNIDRRNSFGNTLTVKSQADIRLINQVYIDLNGFLPLLLSPSLYQRALATLNTANYDYGRLRAGLIDIVGNNMPELPPSVDFSASQSIGSIAGLFHVVARSTRPLQLIGYVISALLFDLFAAYSGAAVVLVSHHHLNAAIRANPRTSDVDYLWTPPPKDSDR